jgi:hypothetical protein
LIKIELSLAVCLYLIFSVIGLLIVWVFIDKRKGPGRVSPEEKFVWQCPICTYFYVDSQNDEYSICPRCKSYNTRKEKGGAKG